MTDILKQIEAILFAAGKKTELEYIAKLCHVNDLSAVKDALEELKKQLDERESPLMLVEEGNFWKLTTREKYQSLVQKIVPHMEFSKSIMETLAVVAWKQPAIQSDIIKIRTNKAYDHIKELNELGFITSDKFGRTRKLKVTQKFLDYFDLKGHEDVRELFKELKVVDSDKKLGELEVYDEEGADTPEKIMVESDEEVERIHEVNEKLDKDFGGDVEPDVSDEPVDELVNERVPIEEPLNEHTGEHIEEQVEESAEEHSEEQVEEHTEETTDEPTEKSDEAVDDTTESAEEMTESTETKDDTKSSETDSDTKSDESEDIYSPEYGKPKKNKSFDDMLDEDYDG